MEPHYHIRYKHGDHEFEIESHDRAFVEAHMETLSERQKPQGPKPRDKGKAEARKKTPAAQQEELDIATFLDKMKEAAEFAKLEKMVLDKPARLPKVMLCLYYAKEFNEDPHLTTGQIETITNQLGVRIHKTNVGKVIKENQSFFTAKQVRRQGAVVPYKLNRQGIREFTSKFLESVKNDN